MKYDELNAGQPHVHGMHVHACISHEGRRTMCVREASSTTLNHTLIILHAECDRTPAVHIHDACMHERLLITNVSSTITTCIPVLSQFHEVCNEFLQDAFYTHNCIYTSTVSYKFNFIMRSKRANSAHSVIAINLILLTQF